MTHEFTILDSFPPRLIGSVPAGQGTTNKYLLVKLIFQEAMFKQGNLAASQG